MQSSAARCQPWATVHLKAEQLPQQLAVVRQLAVADSLGSHEVGAGAEINHKLGQHKALHATQRDVEAVARRRKLSQLLASRLVTERQRHARGVHELAAGGELESVPLVERAHLHFSVSHRAKELPRERAASPGAAASIDDMDVVSTYA